MGSKAFQMSKVTHERGLNGSGSERGQGLNGV